MSKDKKPTPEDGARFPSSFSLARNRAIKRGALWVGGISLTAFAVILLFGGIAGANQGFTTTIDRGSNVDSVVLRAVKAASQDDNGVYFLHAEGLTNAKPTSVRRVLEFTKGLYDRLDLAGENILSIGDVQYAFAYTFYLDNVSEEKEQRFTFYVSLDAYTAPSNLGANNPYSYLRLLVYANLEGSGRHDHTFYAAPNDLGQGTVEGGKDDLREALAEYDDSARDEEGNTLRESVNVPEGEQPYCVSFADNTKEILREETTLEPKKTMRYTIVAYFEGEDPDCEKQAPSGASITFSAHFGD